MSADRDERPGLFGVAVAACIACCIPVAVVVLGGIGVAGLVGALFVGVAGLVVAGLAAVAIIALRRRRTPG